MDSKHLSFKLSETFLLNPHFESASSSLESQAKRAKIAGQVLLHLLSLAYWVGFSELRVLGQIC